MPAATMIGGALRKIDRCYIRIPRPKPLLPGQDPEFVLYMNTLPEISDQKAANYTDENLMGRSSPMKTYSHSENRSISVQIHMIVSAPNEAQYNLEALRAIQSAVYPRHSGGQSPFIPPVICKIKCGSLLADEELCVVLKQYNVKFPTEVAWDEILFTPFKFDIETSWEVVYKSSDLPGSERIFAYGS
jgi:hypothetical protein